METCRGHSIKACLVGGGYRVTVMIHLDERNDFDYDHSPGNQTHLL